MEEKGTVYRLQANYYRNIGDSVKYEAIQNSYVQEIWNNATELNMQAWAITQNENERTEFDLKLALKCIERSIELKSQYANNDTYAWVLYYLGQTEKAHKQAKKAIEMAKSENESYGETLRLLELVKEKN